MARITEGISTLEKSVANPYTFGMSSNLHRRGILILGAIFGAILLNGCATTNAEKGPDGTVAYYVNVEASDTEVRIEVNQEYLGKAPLTLKVFGDDDGTFHNFGSSDYVIRAIPSATNLFPQTKVFRTGGWFSQEDKIPKAIYFDMKQQGFSIDSPRY